MFYINLDDVFKKNVITHMYSLLFCTFYFIENYTFSLQNSIIVL